MPEINPEYERGFKDGLKSKIGEELQPMIAQVLEGISEVIKGLIPSMIDIMEIKAKLDANDWIPCSEMMPAEWQIVAAYGEKIGLKCVEWHPEMGVFIDTQSEYDEQIKPEYFTRWIPLPEEGDSDA